jgi:hypothetical protein
MSMGWMSSFTDAKKEGKKQNPVNLYFGLHCLVLTKSQQF